MNSRSLRFRLVLWYALWLGVVFVTAGTLLYLALGHYLTANLAALERSRAERVARLARHLDARQTDAYTSAITAAFAPEASARFIRLTRADGQVVYASGAPSDGSFDPRQIGPAPATSGLRQEALTGGPALLLATLVTTNEPPLRVEVGESVAPVNTELHRLAVALAAGFALVLVVALAGGSVLVNRSLRLVAEITRGAEGITSRNLNERLPVPATGDEFEQLSLALNRMIARLDETLQHERRFMADASHELRTPLTILRSELEGLVQRPGLDLELHGTLDTLLEEVQRLARIVENLFALSRLETGLAAAEAQPVDLAKLAATTAEQMCLLAEDKQIKIICHTAAPVWLAGDRGRFKQVIVNLLDNAIKYTPGGGVVRLSVHASGTEAICEVADNGMGIPAADLPRVFDRFYRVDPARNRQLGGAGIGLSIVKAICTAHNGRVEVTSTPGQGSCFRVCLPLSTPLNVPNLT